MESQSIEWEIVRELEAVVQPDWQVRIGVSEDWLPVVPIEVGNRLDYYDVSGIGFWRQPKKSQTMKWELGTEVGHHRAANKLFGRPVTEDVVQASSTPEEPANVVRTAPGFAEELREISKAWLERKNREAVEEGRAKAEASYLNFKETCRYRAAAGYGAIIYSKASYNYLAGESAKAFEQRLIELAENDGLVVTQSSEDFVFTWYQT